MSLNLQESTGPVQACTGIAYMHKNIILQYKEPGVTGKNMERDRAQGCLQNVVYGKYREFTSYRHSFRMLRMQRASAVLPHTSSFRSAQARWQPDLSANYCSSRHGRIMCTALKGRDVFSLKLCRSADQSGQCDCCVALATVRTHVNDKNVINLPSNKFALPFWLHISEFTQEFI